MALDSQSGTLALAVREGPILRLQLQGASAPEDIETIGEFPFLASLTWSDDGCRLAFVAGAEATRAHVFMVGVNGRPSRLTTRADEYRVIDWAANGKHILVSTGGVIGGGLRSINTETKESRSSSVADFKVDTHVAVRASPQCS